MSNVVHWLLELDINPGKLDDLTAVMEDMIENTKTEPGALIYEWCFNEDKTAFKIYERYADSEAVLIHLEGFGSKFAERFLGAVTPTAMTVMGNPNAAARKALAGLNPSILTFEAGFAR
ncbi:antibiotic biosynthesis monooxygenase [Leisingera sp. SS27]|uniref:putative quinol monooxygenase n=1 Tax=Leisingera sp. SS27 TaxID=2979462 RepID=UPI00232F63B6|nr:antibiotic biosynthesis monooxygenase [Leisingera sp. SS27]MDC0660567.1 antibiotic biosynthesis monooxygenase [Leisingera sp. SS27]